MIYFTTAHYLSIREFEILSTFVEQLKEFHVKYANFIQVKSSKSHREFCIRGRGKPSYLTSEDIEYFLGVVSDFNLNVSQQKLVLRLKAILNEPDVAKELKDNNEKRRLQQIHGWR